MSIIINNPSNSQRNVFDQGMIYCEHLPKIKQEIKEQVLNQVDGAARKWENWTNSRIARKLIDEAYKNFGAIVKQRFSHPKLNYFLDCSIKNEYTYFYNDLFKIVEEALNQCHPDDLDSDN